MASDVFDMYSSKNSNELMVSFLRDVTHPNRVVVMSICDEGTFNVDDVLREEVRRRGSALFHKLSWRSMWAMACANMTALAEVKEDSAENAQGSWAEPVQMEVDLVGEGQAGTGQEPGCAKWGGSAAGDRRLEVKCL